MIPKILHQIWIGNKKEKPEELMATWRLNHPGWDYMLWDEQEITALQLANSKQYEASPSNAGRADVARYEILLKFGGFFIDADSLSIKRIDESLLNNDFVATFESETYRPGLLANGYIGCAPSSPVMRELIAHIGRYDLDHVRAGPPWQITGPGPYSSFVDRMKTQIKIEILQSWMFIPVHFEDRRFIRKRLSNIENEDIDRIKSTYSSSYSYQFWGTTVEILTTNPESEELIYHHQ